MVGGVSASDHLNPQQFFHGSSQEFEPGDLVRPQRDTGAPNWAEQLGHTGPLGPHYTGEHVHHADTPYEARVFGRHVYQVEPLSVVEPDPESAGQGWTRNRGPARVVRRIEGR